MKIVFMGTPDFAVPCLDRIIKDGHEVAAVYTQPDKPVGRHAVLTPPPVKELALKHNIPVHQPVKLRDGTVCRELNEIAPDCIVVVAYGRILPEDILNVPPLGCINIHGSLLPKYRGAAPIQWSVINGDPETGVTAMFMDVGMDTGDIIDEVKTPIPEDMTAGELFDYLAPMGAELLSATLKKLENGTAVRHPQNEADATMAPMLSKEMGALDFAKPARTLHNAVRGMNPWPGCTCRANDKKLKVHKTAVTDGKGRPGEILSLEPLTVACGEGALTLLTVQPEGKPRMAGDAWVRGARLVPGDSLKNG